MASSFSTKTTKKKLQFSYKKTKLIPGKCPDLITQYRTIYRIKNLTVLAKAELFHLVYADPTHKVHNTIVGDCWQTKGEHGTVIIQSNTGRKRITILGFIDAISLNFVSFITQHNCNTVTNKIAHQELRKAYPDDKEIIIIQDNAGYNHALAKDEIIEEMNITPLFLPPYSPNLNLIERLWKLMKKIIVRNTYYETFKEFWDAIIDFCGNTKKYNQEIKKIMSQKFQILKAV